MASDIKANEAKRDVVKVNLPCYARLVSRQQKWWVRTEKCFYGEILKSKLQKCLARTTLIVETCQVSKFVSRVQTKYHGVYCQPLRTKYTQHVYMSDIHTRSMPCTCNRISEG